MPYKIDHFTFSDQTVDNFQRVGITPDKIEGWIADGRANGVADTGIREFIKDQYADLYDQKYPGRNLSDAARFVASKIPVVGGGVDEAEAFAKTHLLGEKSYDEYLRNARQSRDAAEAAFKENTANGNWFDRHIGKYAPIALSAVGDAMLAVGSGGATLMPRIAGAQGAVEGFLEGEGETNRAINAALYGGLRYGLASVMNKIFPTKDVADKTVKEAAKGKIVGNKKPLGNVIAKSIEKGEEPVTVIAKESTRGTEPAILKNMQMALKGNDAQAKVVYDSALRNVDYKGGFVQYMKDHMPKGLSPKVADRLSRGFAALEGGFETAAGDTGDILVRENLPQMIDSVINTAMRGASAAEREAVKQSAIRAFSERHVAKEIVKRLIPQNMVGQIGNQVSTIRPDRIITRPLSNWLNKGTLNTLQYVAPTQNLVSEATQSQLSNAGRAIMDALILRQ